MIDKKFILILIAAVAMSRCGNAQIYNQNIVGYINKYLYPGQNLIANQLSNSNNTLTVLFNTGIPNGSTFTKWNSVSREWEPLSMYSTTSGWSINYGLDYGEGGLLTTTAQCTNTFVGLVWSGFQASAPNYGIPEFTGDGVFLMSCLLPLDGATFYQVVGRDPLDGEYVTRLDAVTQTWVTSSFDGSSWDNGIPSLRIGEAAFFGIGNYAAFAAVPEPSSLTCFALGGVLIARFGRGGKRRSSL